MIRKIFANKKITFPILLFIFTLPAFSFLLKPNMYWNMHDDMQMIRQLELEKCLKDGQIPCRWSPDLGYQYGYPLFNFYPPMPYIVGQVFRTFGVSFSESVRLTAVAQIVLSALFMYILAQDVFGKLGGLMASLFYTYAPYHAVNIYIRGAMNEAWAGVFFPIILFFAKKLIEKKSALYVILLSISFACLMLSHNPMTLIFAPVLFFWSIFWLIKYHGLKLKSMFPVIFKLSLSAVLALSIAAFYTLPVLFESKLVQIESMFSNYYHFSVHFTSLRQLFISNFWGDGASVWGQNDDMSFAVGYLHWIIPLIILIVSLVIIKLDKGLKNKSIYFLSIGVVLAALFATFMTHERSAFLWLILAPVQKIQFPWRFLSLSNLLFSLSIGFFPIILNRIQSIRIKSIIFVATITGLFMLNVGYFTPLHFGPITDEQKFSGLAWRNQVTSGIYDYLPKTASKAALKPAAEFVDDIDKGVSYQVTGLKKGTDWMFGNITLPREANVTLAQLAFPNFELTVNGAITKYSIDPEFGRIVVKLPAGTSQIYLKLRNTPVRIVSNIITLVALAIVTGFSVKSLWMKLKSKTSSKNQLPE